MLLCRQLCAALWVAGLTISAAETDENSYLRTERAITPPANTALDRITLFEGPYFGGAWLRLGIAEPDLRTRRNLLPTGENWNNRARSIRITGEKMWRLCTRINYGGTCTDLPPGYHSHEFRWRVGVRVLSSFKPLPIVQPLPCFCCASTDPHYMTYDGQIIHFQGKCRYTLTETLDLFLPCSFKIHVINEERYGRIGVTYTRSVVIKIQGYVIRLGPGKRAAVNRRWVSLPWRNGLFRITYNGRRVYFRSLICKIIVKFDGTNACVRVPGKWRGKMTGLCGDCNGQKDDLRTKDGVQVGKQYATIGNSYFVGRGIAKLEECDISDITILCTGTLKDKIDYAGYCGLFLTTTTNNPFASCLASGKVDVQEMHESCVFDVCAFEETAQAKNLACTNLEALVAACAEAGYRDIVWRTRASCPLVCGTNETYNFLVPSTVDTCARPACDDPNPWLPPPEEGCMCQQGYLLSDNQCVPQDNCGCTDANGSYHSLGSTWLADDCSKMYECNKNAENVVTITETAYTCQGTGVCSVIGGELGCHPCNDPIDLAFLLDESGSVGSSSWPKVLGFVSDVVNELNIGLDQTRVSVTKFGTDATVQFHLNQYGDKATILNQIQSISYGAGWTNTQAGLNLLRTDVFTNANGDRDGTNGTADIPNIAIVFTDGKSNVNPNRTIPEADALQNAGVSVIVVAVNVDFAMLDDAELTAIATDPDADNVVKRKYFDGLATITEVIRGLICALTEGPA